MARCLLGQGCVVALALIAGACRIEDRSPTGSRLDEESIRAVVAGYYQGVADGRWPESRALFWDSALVQLRTGPDPVWRGFASPDAYGQYLAALPASSDRTAVRPVRIDARQEGEIAAAWVETRPVDRRFRTGSTDHFVFRRIGGAWRITGFTSIGRPGPE